MRLLTWNTHSLHGEDRERDLEAAVSLLCRLAPDVIALQEVNQSRSAPLRKGPLPEGYRFCSDQVLLRQDHYGLALLTRLAERGLSFGWSWLPVKVGYGRYDEGLMLLCRAPLAEVSSVVISERRPYGDWRRRMALMARAAGSENWFVNLHTGWWEDREDPFSSQWRRLRGALPKEGRIWLMGDFNNPAHRRGEGYDLVASEGFLDCYAAAKHREGENTVPCAIDGWRDGNRALRIDQIWCNRSADVSSVRVLFDGRNSPVLSDHFGVLAEIGGL